MHKLIKISSYYPQFLSAFYNGNKNLYSFSFDAHRERLFKERFSWSDAWKYYLEKTRDWKVEEVVFNDETLQMKWAHERGVRLRSKGPLVEIAALQIAEFEPDVIFFNVGAISKKIFDFLSKIWPQCHSKIVVNFDGVGMHKKGVVFNGDIILSCLPDTVEFYNRKKGSKGYYFMHGFDSRVWWEVPEVPLKSQPSLGFVGQASFFGGHRYRAEFLEKISCHFDSVFHIGSRMTIRALAGRIRKFGWSAIREIFQYGWRQRALERKSREPVFGLGMYKAIASSSVHLNVHIDAAERFAANLRLFEVTGMGTCLLTDNKANLSDLFTAGVEVVTYENISDAFEKIRFLITNQDEGAKIAAKGMKRCWNSHLLSKRIADFESYLRNEF